MTQLWLCGQYKSGEELEAIVWEFQGIFSTKEKAIAACRNSSYFICPVDLDEEWLDETVQMPDAEYPIQEDLNGIIKETDIPKPKESQEEIFP